MKRNYQTSEGGDSRVAMVALVSTSKTCTKLSSEVDALMSPEEWAATLVIPRLCSVLVRSRTSSSEHHSLTISSSDPIINKVGQVSVAGTHVAAHTDSLWEFSTNFSPASFIAVKIHREELHWSAFEVLESGSKWVFIFFFFFFLISGFVFLNLGLYFCCSCSRQT